MSQTNQSSICKNHQQFILLQVLFIDLPDNVPAVLRPMHAKDIHRVLTIERNGASVSCRGAICSNDVHKIIVDYLQYDQSYLDSLPDVYKTINPESVERQVKELG